MDNIKNEFVRLVEIVTALRDPKTGCPWDVKQTPESLLPYLIEESYEVLEAIKSADDSEIVEELGDLLLQVILHAQIAAEEKRFSILEVLKTASDKLIRRHPHVFGELKLDSVDAVLENWEKIKSQEGKSDKKKGVLNGVPSSLPALLRADRMGRKAARIGLDWNDPQDVTIKIKEEIEEFLSCRSSDSCGSGEQNSEQQANEFGDLLFSLVQYARKLDLDAEICLQTSNDKFARRVAYIEDQNKSQLSPEELELLWQAAKKQVG